MRDVSQNPRSGPAPARSPDTLPPPDLRDPVVDAYRKDVDVTLLRENLQLSVEERLPLASLKRSDDRPEILARH